MGYESRLRFGFAGTGKVLTRFINEAIGESSIFEAALADLILIKRKDYFVLANEFDWYKGFSSVDVGNSERVEYPDYLRHPYSRLYSFGYECSEKYLKETDFGEDHELHGAFLRVGEEPDDVEAVWFGECPFMHYSIGNLRVEFCSEDTTLHLAEGIRIREGMPELGAYKFSCPDNRVVDGKLDEDSGKAAFERQLHLGGSLHTAIAIMNPDSFTLKTELLAF